VAAIIKRFRKQRRGETRERLVVGGNDHSGAGRQRGNGDLCDTRGEKE